MLALGEPGAPVVSVSCADTLLDIIAENACGVFEPEAKCRNLPNAKVKLLGSCIDLQGDHSFTTTKSSFYVELEGTYPA